jgi:4-amino-4-deoxy-L-arabinose transferase-like glycosyltransferase
MKTLSIFVNQYVLLFVIIVLGFWLRLYRIESPVADWHSWRQADTAAVARSFYQEGFNPFIPKYDDMTGVSEFNLENPNRYRFVEFPIYNSLVYFAYLLNGGVDERLARLVSILFSLGSIIILFLLVRRIWGKLEGVLAALLFAVLPYNVFYSRTILPEPALVFFYLGALYFVDRYTLENKKWLIIIGTFMTICALLVKPFAIFFLLPLGYSYARSYGVWPLQKRFVYFALLSALPLILWRIWIGQHPEGIPASSWLLNGNGIRLRPAFFRWIFADRLNREILSIAGGALFFLGVFLKAKRQTSWLLHFLLLSSCLYVVVVATGNVQHDYYQVVLVPAKLLCPIWAARHFCIRSIDLAGHS